MIASAAPNREMLPRATLAMAGAVVLFAILAAGAARIAGVPVSASPAALRAAEGTTPIASRDLQFLDRADGAVVIRDVRTGTVASVIPTGEKTGFIRGVLRALARERHQRGVGPAAPFNLTAWRDGQLSLTDPATGRSVELTAFGATNRAAFAALLASEDRK